MKRSISAYGLPTDFTGIVREAIPAPSITSITPSSGAVEGGDAIVIRGVGFTGATSVTFDGVEVSFSVESNFWIECTTPPGTGAVPVEVTTPYGTDSASFTFGDGSGGASSLLGDGLLGDMILGST